MIFENYIKTNKTLFISKVNQISSLLGIEPDWLMFTMMFESGLNPKAINQYTKAVGLIQFMPNTALGLGITTDLLYQMSNIDQLDYVYKYLKPYVGKMHSMTDVYFAVFFPAAIGKPNTHILQTSSLSASKIAEQNQIFDLNKDKQITVGEVTQYLETWLKKKI